LLSKGLFKRNPADQLLSRNKEKPMALVDQSTIRNKLLATLSAEDFSYVAPHLMHVTLPFRGRLHRANGFIEYALFPERGYALTLARIEEGDTAEVGMTGSEGMIGVPLILDTTRSTYDVVVQGEGSALGMPARAFRSALAERPAFQALMLHYVMAFSVQVSMIAACNCHHTIKQRLARCLIMAHARADGNKFAMTHEAMAMILGVRRAGVSEAIRHLQCAGSIETCKGHIRILDPHGLERAACGCHLFMEDEFRRLLD
jgi:CRP-like cAMP-binding protein